MKDRRNGDRLYTAVLLAFLVGLVALGLLGIPALLVAAIGLIVAAAAIVCLARGRQTVPERYVPSVLESSSVKRRRPALLRRHRHPAPPLRFR